MNNDILVIGISGPIKSGKSEAARYIQKQFNNVHILSFAYPLKKMIQDLFYLEPNQLQNHELKELKDSKLGVSPRKLMQFMGTEVFRNKNMLRSLYSPILLPENEYPIFLQQQTETFWIWHLHKKIESILSKNNKPIIVIEDVRYEDEYDFLKKTYNAKFIYLQKTNDKEQNSQGHSSEQNHLFLQSNADFVINNNSTLEFFYDQLQNTLLFFHDNLQPT